MWVRRLERMKKWEYYTKWADGKEWWKLLQTCFYQQDTYYKDSSTYGPYPPKQTYFKVRA